MCVCVCEREGVGVSVVMSGERGGREGSLGAPGVSAG